MEVSVAKENSLQDLDAPSRPRTSLDRDGTTAERCTICLEEITERAITVPCNHLTFDFICLVSWIQERSVCPLCNAEVTRIEYDWRSPEDFKTYHVPRNPARDTTSEPTRNSTSQRQLRQRRPQGCGPPQSRNSSVDDPALARRREVYKSRLFSLHVGANKFSRYRDFTQQDFSQSAELQSRARMFLRRELRMFSFLDTASAPRGGNREFLLEYIVAILRTNDIKSADGAAHSMISDYLGDMNARLLLHELEAWLRSPFVSLTEWDANVQYATKAGGQHGNAVEPG